jgi:dTMP kinase
MSFAKRNAPAAGPPVQLPRLWVIEGIDGAGTTTQARLLVDRLESAGVPVWGTSEPTNGPVGTLLRQVLAGTTRVTPETVAYLFAADRCQHIYGDEGILAHHEAGEVVVCDRYVYSSLAYQTVECDTGLVRSLNAGFPEPGLLIFVDLDPDVGEQRLAARAEREIYEQTSIQTQVRARYRELMTAASKSTTLVEVNGAEGEATIHRKIWEAVEATSILKA